MLDHKRWVNRGTGNAVYLCHGGGSLEHFPCDLSSFALSLSREDAGLDDAITPPVPNQVPARTELAGLRARQARNRRQGVTSRQGGA